jgi:hypothetical protein
MTKFKNDEDRCKAIFKIHEGINNVLNKNLKNIDIEDSLDVGSAAFALAVAEFISKIFIPEDCDIKFDALDRITEFAKETVTKISESMHLETSH